MSKIIYIQNPKAGSNFRTVGQQSQPQNNCTQYADLITEIAEMKKMLPGGGTTEENQGSPREFSKSNTFNCPSYYELLTTLVYLKYKLKLHEFRSRNNTAAPTFGDVFNGKSPSDFGAIGNIYVNIFRAIAELGKKTSIPTPKMK